jgi:hypothetical protein
VFVKTAEEVLGFKNSTSKDWLSEKTWKKTKERKIKEKLVSCKTRGRKIKLQAEYNDTDHEVKQNARTDRRRISELAERAEKTENEQNTRIRYPSRQS